MIKKRSTEKPSKLQRQMTNLEKSGTIIKKKTTKELWGREEYFRALIENSLDIIIVVNKKGTVTYVSPSVERFLGYKPGELIGKSAFKFIIPADLPRAVYDFGKAVLTKEVVIPNSFRIRRKDRSECILEGVGKNLLNNPSVRGFVMNVRDITERKKVEEALQKAHQELEEKVKERSAELSKANEELMAKITAHENTQRELQIEARNLEEANIALKVLLKRRDEDKAEMEDKVLLNMKGLVTPYLEKLKMSGLDESQKAYVTILESSLNQITSPFLHRLSFSFANFTPTEIQVANLLKQGKTSKEIGELLNSSSRTIAFHRDNIRKRLGLKNKKTNLKSYLLSLK